MNNQVSEINRSPLPNTDNRLKAKLLHLVSMRGDPTYLALSFAIGVFISVTPIYGLHSLIGIGIALIFQLDLTCLFVGLWVNNPFSAPVIYGICYWIGKTTLHSPQMDPNLSWTELIKTHAGSIFMDLIVGCSIFGIVAGIISFFLVKTAIHIYRRTRTRHHHQSA